MVEVSILGGRSRLGGEILVHCHLPTRVIMGVWHKVDVDLALDRTSLRVVLTVLQARNRNVSSWFGKGKKSSPLGKDMVHLLALLLVSPPSSQLLASGRQAFQLCP